MSRVVVITDPATAEGFQLTGVEVRSFNDAASAREEISELLKDSSVEILVANDSFLKDIDDSVTRLIQSSEFPAVVSLPVERTRSAVVRRKSIAEAIELERSHFDRVRDRAKKDRGRGIATKTSCTVCGNPMAMGMRICDSCGSIQRPTEARGLRSIPAKTSFCKRCGVKVLPWKTLCSDCAADRKKERDRRKKDKSGKATVPGTKTKKSLPARIIEPIRRLERRLFGKVRDAA